MKIHRRSLVTYKMERRNYFVTQHSVGRMATHGEASCGVAPLLLTAVDLSDVTNFW